MTTLIAISLLAATVDGLFYWYGFESIGQGAEAETSTRAFYGAFFVLILILWIDADSKDNPKIFRWLDFGFFLYLLWIPYLPYYLWRTRGARGLLMLVGFICLPLLGFFVQLSIYFLRYG